VNINEWSKRVDELEAQLTAERARTCTWTLEPYDTGVWQSECGELWSFIDGGPEENRARYCHACGGRLITVNYKEESNDAET